MVSRFFYNSSSMACETFLYGGCLGNGNNFYSEKECLQACRTEGEQGDQETFWRGEGTGGAFAEASEGFQEWPQTPHVHHPCGRCGGL